jgi:hypothetical protein
MLAQFANQTSLLATLPRQQKSSFKVLVSIRYMATHLHLRTQQDGSSCKNSDIFEMWPVRISAGA